MTFKVLDHKTDLKIKVSAKTKKELFKDACLAISEAILPKRLNQYPEQEEAEVKIEANSLGDRLIDFLNEVLYLSDINNLSYQTEEFISFTDNSLKAKLIGHRVPAEDFDTEIKAATHHGLEIKKSNNHLEVTIIFDI